MAPGSVSTLSRAELPGPAVRVHHLEAGYGWGRGRVEVLRGVNLSADPGCVTAVVGPNGAGKTTLFRLLLGFLPPRAGSVRIGGTTPTVHRLARGIAYLPESLRPPAGWRVGELFLEGARLGGLPPGERLGAVTEARAMAGLEEASLRTPLAGLSRGMARRVQLAYALIGRPGLVLLDEPWSGLDPPARARLRTTIREISGSGATVILASHELDQVQRVADRAILIRRGRVIRAVGDPEGMVPGGLEEALLRELPE